MSFKKKDISAAFVQFLFKNNYVKDNKINKKKCQQYFVTFCILNKLRIRAHDMLYILKFTSMIKKLTWNSDAEIISFTNKAFKICKLDGIHLEISTTNENTKKSNVQNGLPGQIKERPRNRQKGKFVSQRVALPSIRKEIIYISEESCDLCKVTFSNVIDYKNHLEDIIHKLRHTYRKNRKEFIPNHDKIVIESADEGKNEFKITANADSETTFNLYVKNKTNNMYKISDVIHLYVLPEVNLSYKIPIILNPLASVTISGKFSFVNESVYMLPLIFKLENPKVPDDCMLLLKELYFYIQSDEVKDLQATAPYARGSRAAAVIEDIPVIDGVRPPKNAGAQLEQVHPIQKYPLPKSMIKILNAGLKDSPSLNPMDKEELMTLKKLLSVKDRKTCLTSSNYCKMLVTLLHFEEHQMQKDIRDYDCHGQVLKKIRGKPELLELEVPGLAENRPSLLRGDAIFIRNPKDKCRYRAYIHRVHQNSVELGLPRKFVAEMNTAIDRYSIQFDFNRLTLKTEHQAVDYVKKHKIEKYFFPITAPQSVQVSNIQFDWFERKIASNEEQQQAVRHIISCTSYPFPYLLFGPPGTGKTMTLVETILQLYKLKPQCKILVAAPSNSAANEVTSRLVKHINNRMDIFRMISASFAFDRVPDNITKFCNYVNGEYFFPTLKDLLKYRILIVTLTTAAKLLGAEIPTDHFQYVFIDESGHSTESEVLIPIAGIITDVQKINAQIILAGDPKQLGPIIHSKLAESYGYGTSMLERLMNTCDVYKKDENGDYNPVMVTKLLKNFRSHSSILQLPDEMFYDEELITDDNNELTKLALGWEHLPNTKFPIIFHSVKGADLQEENSPSYFNLQEIDVVLKYLNLLINQRLCGRLIKESDIGIVSPYRKQVQKITLACKKKHWNDILIGSVEQFQGQERLIIIISTVRSQQELLEHDYRYYLGFLKNPKRFNVAITRTKALLIVIGNPDILQCDKHWGQFIEYCYDNNAYTGTKFSLKNRNKINNDENEENDYLKNTIQCDPEEENLHGYEYADFSRGNA